MGPNSTNWSHSTKFSGKMALCPGKDHRPHGNQGTLVRSETKMGWGPPFPADPSSTAPWLAREQAGYSPFLGSAATHSNPSSEKEVTAMLYWSNLDQNCMGILNCCTSALPLCFAMDCTDRQAFIIVTAFYIDIDIYTFLLNGKFSLMYWERRVQWSAFSWLSSLKRSKKEKSRKIEHYFTLQSVCLVTRLLPNKNVISLLKLGY